MKVKELFEAEERSVLSVMGKQKDPYSDSFYCGNKNLTSLEGAPKSVGGEFSCGNNSLTSLEGAPTSVGDNFYCHNNKLTSLTSLEGAPTSVGGNFYCHNNKLTSLKGIHKQIKHISRAAIFIGNPIKSHILGLLKIGGLQSVELDNRKAGNIINKHLEGNKDIFACQEELIEAGFPEFAQL